MLIYNLLVQRFLRQDTCEDILDELSIKVGDSNLCARAAHGDVCKGDSGGGLIIQKDR